LSSAVLYAVLGANEDLRASGVLQRLLPPLGAVGQVAWVAVLFADGHVIKRAVLRRRVERDRSGEAVRPT
jgi:prepilin-type processing-associated H-X9-DG protein